MSAEETAVHLNRLCGQHPAALRWVSWNAERPRDHAYLEIETKRGQVCLIDPGSGIAYSRPPAPPGLETEPPRWRCDLTEAIPDAFDGRPVITSIRRLSAAGGQESLRFELSTGRSFEFPIGAGITR